MWGLLKKLRIELPYDAGTTLLGICLTDLKTFICKDICTPTFTAAPVTVAQTWKLLKGPSVEDWVQRMWYIHIYYGHYSAVRRDEMLPSATNMGEP